MGQVVIPAGFAEVIVNIEGPVGAKTPMNVYGVAIDVLEPLADVADQLQIAFVDWAAVLLDGYTCTHLTFRLGDSAPPYASFDIPISVVGGGSNPTAPQVSALVKKTSLVAGRQGRGRSYWPGVLSDTNVEDDGTIASGKLTSLQGVADDLVAALNVAPLQGFYILHGEGTPLADTPTATIQYTVESRIATQRRRNR